MSAVSIAWVVIACAALLGAVAMWIVFSRYGIGGVLRSTFVALLLALFLVPAPIPGYESELAPAFIVLIFETFFQIDGEAQGSVRNLLLGLLVAIGLSLLTHYLLNRYGRSAQTAGLDSDEDTQDARDTA